jgi:hypothetical protein
VYSAVPDSPVRTYSHLGVSVMFTMPFTFSIAEYVDMIYVFGLCGSNSVHDVRVDEYQ